MKIVQTQDCDIIAKLNKDVQDVHARLFPQHFKPYDETAIRDFFRRAMSNSGYIFLLGTEQDQYVGYAWIEIKRSQENAFRHAYQSVFIHHLAVVEEHRSKGYGMKLMDQVEEIARMNGINEIELDYWSGNAVAKQFYDRNGFKLRREFVYKTLQVSL